MVAPTSFLHRRADWLLLGLLFLAAFALKSWLLARSPMFARDGVGFIELAQRLKEEPWSPVIQTAHQHPLYPINIWATASVYQGVVGRPLLNLDWLDCAHLANVWASLLALVPMYFLGKRLGGPWVGFAGTLLFIALPMPALILSDTLSEGTYLLFLLTGLWALVRGLETTKLPWFAAAGLCGGLAFLARPEGAMAPVVAGFLLLALKAKKLWPASWGRTTAALACVSCCTLLVTGPYWWTIGGLGKKTTFQEMLNVTAAAETPSTALLLASRFQPGVDGFDWASITPLFVTKEVTWEVARGFHYFALVPALFGLWLLWKNRELRQTYGARMLIAVGLLNWALLWWLAWRAKYVSERHTIFIVLLGCWLAALALRRWAETLEVRWPLAAGRAMPIAVALLLGLLGVGLVEAVRPQHQQRLAHREAGFWLKEQLHPGDFVVDPYGYAAFFAERRVIYQKPTPKSADHKTYLVFEPGEKDKHRLRVASKVRDRGEIVRQWPDPKKPRVVVYVSKEQPGPATQTANR